MLTAVLTVASVVGVAHGSAATESVAVASLGSMKETAPVCGASNHASTVAPPPPGEGEGAGEGEGEGKGEGEG